MIGVNLRDLQKNVEVQYSDPSEKNKVSWLRKDIQLFSKGVSTKKKEQFYSGLELLISAGMNLQSALEMLAQAEEDKALKELYLYLNQKLIDGHSFNKAMSMSSNFTPYEYYSIKIGEESGKLTDVLTELSLYFNRKLILKRQLIAAMTYPVIVVVTAILAIFFMMSFIVPMFSDVYQRFGEELPSLTKIVMRFSAICLDYYPLLILVLLAISVVHFINRKKDWYGKALDRLLLQIPVIGPLLLVVSLSRFCRSMALLLGSGVPVLDGINMTKEMITFYPVKNAIINSEERILKGDALHQSLAELGRFDNKLPSLIQVGEETNKLDWIFKKSAEQYDQELEHKFKQLSNLLEPILILFLGLIVGVTLIAMYLPMFRMSLSLG